MDEISNNLLAKLSNRSRGLITRFARSDMCPPKPWPAEKLDELLTALERYQVAARTKGTSNLALRWRRRPRVGVPIDPETLAKFLEWTPPDLPVWDGLPDSLTI